MKCQSGRIQTVELYSPLKFSIVLVGILLGPCRKCAKSKSRKLEQGFYCVYLQLLAQEWNHEMMTCNSTYC